MLLERCGGNDDSCVNKDQFYGWLSVGHVEDVVKGDRSTQSSRDELSSDEKEKKS